MKLIMKLLVLKNNNSQCEYNFLYNGLSNINEKDEILINYHPKYENNNANLFYLLKSNRFETGNYFVLKNDSGEYAGSAGWYQYANDTALGAVRAYVPNKFRTKFYLAKYILPKIMDESANYPKLWLTFNEYNKSFYNCFVRAYNNKSRTVGLEWPNLYKLFTPIGLKIINKTLQYVVEYEKSNT